MTKRRHAVFGKSIPSYLLIRTTRPTCRFLRSFTPSYKLSLSSVLSATSCQNLALYSEGTMTTTLCLISKSLSSGLITCGIKIILSPISPIVFGVIGLDNESSVIPK